MLKARSTENTDLYRIVVQVYLHILSFLKGIKVDIMLNF